jgi:hypothetical protein
MAYDIDIADLQRRAAIYVDRILKGAKPADLPVEQPTHFNFVIFSRPPRRSVSPSRNRSCSAPTKWSSETVYFR